jgi:hypothetical protein
MQTGLSVERAGKDVPHTHDTYQPPYLRPFVTRYSLYHTQNTDCSSSRYFSIPQAYGMVTGRIWSAGHYYYLPP